MKIRSTVNRRSFDLVQAGFYSFLRPSRRFTASHLQRVFPFLARQTKRIEDAGPPELLQKQPGMDARSMLRWGLIILAAVAITLGWLFGSPLPWRHIGPWLH
jgi:hypothetical protein